MTAGDETRTVSDDGEERDDLDDLRSEILRTPAGRTTYQDAKRRNSMLATMAATRKTQDLSQKKVARAMGTTQSAVSQIESGRADPQLRTLQRYARAINLRLDIAVVDDDLPSYDEGMANGLWRVVEQMAWSPLLTALTTNSDKRNRTLDSLATAARLPSDLVRPILSALEDRGWITSSGRKKVYELRDDAAYTIGISVRRDAVVGVLLNLRGREVESRTVQIETSARRTVINTVVDVAAHLYRFRGIREVLGVGVSVAGVVNIDTGTVEFAPDLAGDEDAWTNVELEGEIEETLQERVKDPHLLVAVENDANALAMREHLREGERCVVAVLMSASGSGLGIGVAVDGKVIYGEDHAAGEGGHIIVDSKGEPCRSGKHRGCLETVATAEGVLRQLDLAHDTPESVQEGLIVVNDRVRRGDESAIHVLHNAGHALGMFLATAMVLFNPTRVAIFGHREIVDAEGRESAGQFREGVTEALRGGVAKEALMLDRLDWRVLGEKTEADAAGAAARYYFLEHPNHWRPAVLSSRTVDAVKA